MDDGYSHLLSSLHDLNMTACESCANVTIQKLRIAYDRPLHGPTPNPTLLGRSLQSWSLLNEGHIEDLLHTILSNLAQEGPDGIRHRGRPGPIHGRLAEGRRVFLGTLDLERHIPSVAPQWSGYTKEARKWCAFSALD